MKAVAYLAAEKVTCREEALCCRYFCGWVKGLPTVVSSNTPFALLRCIQAHFCLRLWNSFEALRPQNRL